MFTENFKIKALEHSRIKNLQEFNLNLDECQTIFSKDSKYGVLYTELFIAILDLNKKSLISKHSSDKSAKISKLKLTHKNNITYMKKFSSHTVIVLSSIDFLGEYFQLTVSDEIIDYIYVENNELQDKEESLFLISSRGELYYYSQLELRKKTNIIEDSGNIIKSWHMKEINTVEFVEETKNLLIIFSNGLIINYCLSNDPENAQDNQNRKKNIYFEEIKHFNASSPNIVFLDNLRYSQDNYEVTAFKIIKFVFDFEAFVLKNDGMEVESENKDIKQSVFVCVGYTKNKKDSYLCFYEIVENQLILINEILLENKIIVDSCSYLSNNISLKSQVPDYFILCCRLLDKNKIQILASDFLECLKKRDNILSNRDDIFKNAKISNELFTIINEIPDMDSSIKKLSIIGVYVTKNPDYILKANQMQSFFQKKMLINNEYDNIEVCSEYTVMTNINELKNLNYQLNLIIRLLVNYNKIDAYLVDLDFQQFSFKPTEKSLNKEIPDEFSLNQQIISAITSDVTKHLEFFQQNTSLEFKQKFKEKVLEIISSSEDSNVYKNFKDLPYFSRQDDKTDYYLLLLMSHNDLIPIKHYLSLKESQNVTNKTFILSNDKLFYTVKVFYHFLKNSIYEKLKNEEIDYKFFTCEKILTNMQTALEILKISKNRNEMAYSKPFNVERDIIVEDSITIQNVIFDVENVLMIFKVIRSYLTNIITDEFNDSLDSQNAIIKQMSDLMSLTKKIARNNLIFFELVTLNPYNEIYPNIKKFYINYFNEQKSFNNDWDKNSNGIKGINELNIQELLKVKDSSNNSQFAYNELLYFTKFQFFFYYFYYVMEYLRVKKNSKNAFGNNMLLCEKILSLDKKSVQTLTKDYFKELEEEFSEYFNISNIFYKIDYCQGLKQDNMQLSLHKIYADIEITAVSQFTIKLNKCEIYKTLYYKLILNKLGINLNSTLISFLADEGYIKEALSLSNSILTLVNDFDELKMQLSLLLQMNLINIAYQFVNNCFALLVCYSENFQNTSDSVQEKGKTLLGTIIDSEEFQKMRKLYFYFFEFLIKKNQIHLIYTLPYNFIERHLLKEFFIQNRQYEEFLLIYYIKMKKIKDAENSLNEFTKNSVYSQNLKEVYGRLVECLKFLYGDNYYEKEDLRKLKVSNIELEKLSFEVNATLERENYKNLKGISEIKNFNEMAGMVQDSLMDIDFITYKPSDISVNETIKDLLTKKQKTAKKTFGMFTDVKSATIRKEMNSVSGIKNEKNLSDNLKFKSELIPQKFNIDRTPTRREEYFARPLDFNSNFTIKTNSVEKKKFYDNFLSDSYKK